MTGPIMTPPSLEPIVKSLPEIIKQASQSPLGILALLIVALFGLAIYFFRRAPLPWRGAVFLIFAAGVAAFGWELSQVAAKPSSLHYEGHVRDALTRSALPEARVRVSLPGVTLPPHVTDSDGLFSFWLERKNASDDATVRVERANYLDYERTVSSDASTHLEDVLLARISASTAQSPSPSSSSNSERVGSAAGSGAASDRSVLRLPSGIAVGVGSVIQSQPPSPALPPRIEATKILPAPKLVEVSSGKQLSGDGKNWSPWYSVRTPAAPAEYAVGKIEFWLTGDRACGAWADCQQLVANEEGVVWQFRLQGHDEWGAPRQAFSEGHLKVIYQPKKPSS
jgi:hypothetical protein